MVAFRVLEDEAVHRRLISGERFAEVLMGEGELYRTGVGMRSDTVWLARHAGQ